MEIMTEQSFLIVVLLSGIPLFASCVAALVVSVLQAATQVQEQCLLYIVKISTVVIVGYVLKDWYALQIINLFQEALNGIGMLGNL